MTVPLSYVTQWTVREASHVLWPNFWSGQQLTPSMDTGWELQLMPMFKEKVTFAVSLFLLSVLLYLTCCCAVGRVLFKPHRMVADFMECSE